MDMTLPKRMHTNKSFDIIKGSSGFLDIIMQEIPSCVLLLDSEMMLFAYNDALKTIFSNKPEEYILYKKCGNVIGCAYAVEEEKECGTTSMCKFCSLRESALTSYSSSMNIYKQRLDREFYTTGLNKEMKHLEFSSRVFQYDRERYVVLIINDITALEEARKNTKRQSE